NPYQKAGPMHSKLPYLYFSHYLKIVTMIVRDSDFKNIFLLFLDTYHLIRYIVFTQYLIICNCMTSVTLMKIAQMTCFLKSMHFLLTLTDVFARTTRVVIISHNCFE
ncbi:hypothetical protein L9F63_027034, partial [Diploptera punctata]